MTYAEAYREQLARDEEFHALLVAAYGRMAGDMRYRRPETPEIAAARDAYVRASAAAHAAWRRDCSIYATA